jgi:hypothetical protein
VTSRPNERGSLIIALAVVLVLSSLALAVMVRTVEAVANARVTQDQAAATAAADAGLADASFALDNWTPPAALSGSGPVGAGSYQWTATSTNPLQVDITSVGTANGRSHQIDASATRPAAWPWVVATRSSLVVDGPATVASGGTLGAGGALVLRNGADTGHEEEDLLGPGASCAGCQDPVVEPSTATFPDAVVPSAPQACPTAPVTALTSGTYLCMGVFALNGPVTVAATPALPVVIYVEGSAGLASLDLSGSTVNAGGNPADLIIYVVGPGSVAPGDGATATNFTGIIDAPRSSLRSGSAASPCQFALTGAMVLGSFSCTAASGPGPTLTYDAADLASIPSDAWTISAYQDAVVGS